MYEELRSSTVFSPETMGELANYKQKNPKAIFWAGGTYLMANELVYPSKTPINIISLDRMGELRRISRTEDSVDFGAMVDLQTVAAASRQFFSKEVSFAFSSVATRLIRSQATVGGALCARRIKTSFAAIAITLDASVECKTIGKRTTTRWIALSDLYDETGNVALSPMALVTRLHLNAAPDSLFHFRGTGSPMTKGDEAVIIALRYKLVQNTISEIRVCFNFPTVGLHISEAVQSSLSGLLLPINPVRIMRLADLLMEEIKVSHPGVRPIQVEQASRMFESFLYDLNTRVLSQV